jgi:hypothetical protein
MENFWPVSLKTLANSTVDFFPEAASEFLSCFSSLPLVLFALLLVDFPQCTVRIIADFQKIFQHHRRFPVSVLRIKSHLKDLWQGLMKGFSKLISNFIEASKTFGFDFYINKVFKTC